MDNLTVNLWFKWLEWLGNSDWNIRFAAWWPLKGPADIYIYIYIYIYEGVPKLGSLVYNKVCGGRKLSCGRYQVELIWGKFANLKDNQDSEFAKNSVAPPPRTVETASDFGERPITFSVRSSRSIFLSRYGDRLGLPTRRIRMFEVSWPSLIGPRLGPGLAST